MRISKYEKKIMSIIMIAVIVLSVFICTPKADAADTAKPEVTVLGATLRLGESDNNGSQSMRIGIKIANADKAKDCAIKLELNGKSYTVATSEAALGSENGKVHNTVHSIDKTNNSVVYAVVLTNIPKTSFYDSITITGKSISNDEQETITTSTAAQRNVMGIVNSLQKKYPDLGITINDNGTLVKKDNKVLINDDLDGYNTNDPQEYETVKLEPSKTDKYDHVTINDQGNVILDETGEDIIRFPINTVTVGDTVIVHITGTIGDNSAGLRIYPNAGGDRCMVKDYETITDKGVFDKTIEYVIYDKDGRSNGGEKDDCDTADNICIKGPRWGVKASDITITSLSVTYKGGNPAPTEPGVLDLSKATDSNGSIKVNNDGSVTKSSNSDFILIPLGSEYKKGDVLNVTVWGSSDQLVRLWLSSGAWDRMSEIKNPMNFGETYTLTLQENYNPPYVVQIKKQNATPENLNITKVKVEKIASAEPTPSPEPAPDTYSIENEALKDSYKGENGGPSSTEYDNANNVMNFSFTGYTGVIYSIPDDTIDTSVYKYAQITYTSSGGSLDAYACQADGTYPDGAAASLTASDTENVVTVSGFGKGAIKLFHWGDKADTNIAIKSIKFYKNNPEAATNL